MIYMASICEEIENHPPKESVLNFRDRVIHMYT